MTPAFAQLKHCLATSHMLCADNNANRLMAREAELFPPLMEVLRAAVDRGQAVSEASHSSHKVVDDGEQVTVAAIDTLTACMPGSKGNQVRRAGLRWQGQPGSQEGPVAL